MSRYNDIVNGFYSTPGPRPIDASERLRNELSNLTYTGSGATRGTRKRRPRSRYDDFSDTTDDSPSSDSATDDDTDSDDDGSDSDDYSDDYSD